MLRDQPSQDGIELATRPPPEVPAEQPVAAEGMDLMTIPEGFNRMPSRYDQNQVWPVLNIFSLSNDIATEGLHVESPSDVASHAFALTQALQAIGRSKQALDTKRSVTSAHPNPLIVANLEKGGDPWRRQYDANEQNLNTIRFLRDRSYKQATSAVVSATGNIIAWLATFGLNPLAGPLHLHAAVTSGIHWHKLRKISQKHSATAENVGKWCEQIIGLKMHKQFTRDGQFIARMLPFVPFAGTAINLTSVISSLSYRIAHAEVAGLAAIQIHAHAFHERATEAAERPASEIFEELLARRGMYRLSGAYPIDTLIAEPAGWMVLSNKLLMD